MGKYSSSNQILFPDLLSDRKLKIVEALAIAK